MEVDGTAMEEYCYNSTRWEIDWIAEEKHKTMIYNLKLLLVCLQLTRTCRLVHWTDFKHNERFELRRTTSIVTRVVPLEAQEAGLY
jgi:hypothetical protein